jgi:MFS family permease
VWAGLALPRLLGEDDSKAVKPQKLREMPKALFVISVFVLSVTLAEGAMSDWAAVYLAERWDNGPEDAGIAVTVFAAFLAGGRFIGDWLKRRLGARGVARLTVGFAMTGVLVLTIPTPVQFVFIGVALIGLGVSIAFPLGISAAAALDDKHEAQNIATMSMIAISGFLIGPLLPGLMLSLWLTRIFASSNDG